MELGTEVEDVFFGIPIPSLEYIGNMYEQCIFPNVLQMISKGIWMLIGTLGFNYLRRQTNQPWVFHFLSCLFGLFMLRYSIFNLHITLYYVALVVYSFILILITYGIKKNLYPTFVHYGYIVMAIITASMVLGEIFFPDPEVWFRLRGTAMILCMKVVSFGFCLPKISRIQNLLYFFGFAFFPGNILFGPWISYNEYLRIFTIRQKITILWLLKVIQLFFYSVIMLWLSNCILPMLEWDPYYHGWLHAFIGGLTFRTSHYFVIGLSELTMISSGYHEENEDNQFVWSNKYTKPLLVEFPRSMLSVVVNWNLPIHKFLKQYVFQESVKLLGKFWAIFLTYFYSSMLHGINVEVGVVLLSLGLFSFVELQLREFLSTKLDACVKSRSCYETCKHKHKSTSLRTMLINDMFILLTIVQLVYTGHLMHNRPENATVHERLLEIHHKWANLGYFCHYVAFITFTLTIGT